MATLSNSGSTKAQQSSCTGSGYTTDSNFSLRSALIEWVRDILKVNCYNDSLIPSKIMVPYSLNTSNSIISSINSNNTNNTLNKHLNDDANEELRACHLVLGLKSPPPPCGDFEFSCCLQEKEENLLKLKPPPPPSGDYGLSFSLHEEGKALVESDWNNTCSFNNPGKKRKQSKITNFS